MPFVLLMRRWIAVLMVLALPLQGLAAHTMVMPCERTGMPVPTAAAELPPCHESAPSEEPASHCAACVFCAMAGAALALPTLPALAAAPAARSPLVSMPAPQPQAGFARALERPPRA